MTVPVLWISRHPEILARGYADQGFLEAMLARRVWTPQDPHVFVHNEVLGDDWPEVAGGAVVVLPARHHASADDVAWFRGHVDRLEWSLVILAGDEEWVFPWREIPETPTRRVWVMQPRTEHAAVSGRIPGGWYPGTDAAMAEGDMWARDLDWFFAGQVTHKRRRQLARVLSRMPRGVLHQTEGYLQGMPQQAYWELMRRAKVVPCPSGPMTVDTARSLEALEAGCIPIVDLATPNGPQADYWDVCFGEGHPLRGLTDWAAFPAQLRQMLDGWQGKANATFSWWQQWKRRIVRQLDADVRAVAGWLPQPQGPDDLITVLVSTSPTPVHPSTEHIEETIGSIRERLPRAEILVGVDGVRPEQEDRRGAYEAYTARLLWLANNRWHNVLPIVMGEWLHQAAMTRRLLTEVRTPLVLFVEHDTPLVGEVPWSAMTEAIGHGDFNVIRLHHEASMLDAHRSICLDAEPVQYPTKYGPLPLRRTSAWWQRPHLAATEFYRDMLGWFAPEARTMIEDAVYGILHVAVQDRGEAGWEDWRVAIYEPPGDTKRSTHLDGRGDDPKWPMRFGWTGRQPAGAPGAPS